ncbi:hypothetical protein BDZ91DRAFT_646953 [Kalaharituber pfeilii]|nr:hypothetical protein BDZ91DRAFT_646953 [Kalaharituber pfeilii]
MASVNSNEALPRDTIETGGTLEERLRAWKHVIARLQDYVEAHESLHKTLSKEYEKVGKTIADPLKQSEMFTQQSGGVQAFFENIRTNNQSISVSHLETSRALRNGLLPQLERLHAEIKAKQKELNSGATKGTKAVTKAREHTKKHIDQLATVTGQFDPAGASKLSDPVNDPYIVKRQVLHKLHKQVMDENAQRQDLLAVQNGFQTFEAHVIQTIQASLNEFYQIIGGQQEKVKGLYGDIIGTASRLPLDFEWNSFVQRYGHVLIDPASPNREVASIVFPNQDHPGTKPLIEGALQRKGKLLGRYSTAYYVVTPSKYLHEFEHSDNHNVKEPDPELSLYLPDCKIGALSASPGAKFTLSGKDANKNPKLTREHDFVFKGTTHAEAQKWWEIISHACGVKTGEKPLDSPAPTRENTVASTSSAPPAYEEKDKENLAIRTKGGQQTGTITDGATVASPVTTSPTKA